MTKVERDIDETSSYEEIFEYDLNGNMICQVGNNVTWVQEYNDQNLFSMIRRVNGDCSDSNAAYDYETWTFYYDGDGVRLKEI